jgi:murein DD-endopeptidase MepM/ murein hydrolase activator NlpD
LIRCLTAILALLAALPAEAQTLRLDGKFVQGGYAEGVAAPEAGVVFDGRPVPVSKDGRFVIGFAHDAKPAAKLIVAWPDGREELRQLEIGRRVYKEQRIDGLPKRKVTPEKRDMKRINAESALLKKARARGTPDWFATGAFAWPLKGRISGVYGSRRILNGEPRAPHLGVDIAAPTGTPVHAASDGVVSLTHPGMFFTGKTVMIDHGLGLSSIYIHMSAIAVKDGQRVRKGQLIGKVGKTGRATGPHLHWGMAWFNIRLDPALFVGAMAR